MTQKDCNNEKRVWEIDAIRGHQIAWVLLIHFYIALSTFLLDGIYTNLDVVGLVARFDPLGIFFGIDAQGIYRSFFYKIYLYTYRPGVAVFFVVSGISCMFSRNNLKSGLRLLCGALFVSAFTKLLVLFTGDTHQFIRFGALHCYACCHLIYYFFLEERENKTLLWIAAFSLVFGYYLQYFPVYSNFALLVPFGVQENGVHIRDYWPVFPMLGWFLIGIVLGRRWYSEKKTMFPNQESKKWHRPLCFLGKYSGLIYCGHMVIYTVFFCGVGSIFDLY